MTIAPPGELSSYGEGRRQRRASCVSAQPAIPSVARLSAGAVRVSTVCRACRVVTALHMEAIHRPLAGKKWIRAK
jgi:hypothetical protein